jgi:hypothetical protein
MIRGQSDVFVEMKHFDSFPGKARQVRKSVQQFKLGRAGRSDNSGLALRLDRRRMASPAL